MLRKSLSVLLFSCLTSLSVGVFAAEPAKSEAAPVTATQGPVTAEVQVVNLNIADAAALESGLIGIGKVKAQAAGKRHGMSKRPLKMKRNARGTFVMFKADGEKIAENFLRVK